MTGQLHSIVTSCLPWFFHHTCHFGILATLVITIPAILASWPHFCPSYLTCGCLGHSFVTPIPAMWVSWPQPCDLHTCHVGVLARALWPPYLPCGCLGHSLVTPIPAMWVSWPQPYDPHHSCGRRRTGWSARLPPGPRGTRGTQSRQTMATFHPVLS